MEPTWWLILGLFSNPEIPGLVNAQSGDFGIEKAVRILGLCRHGKAPQYLVDCCTPVTDVVGRQRLRSATQQLMVVPRHRLHTVGRRAFAVHGPVVWNSLPDDLRAQQDYDPLDRVWKPVFSLDTSVFSALETIVIIALYKSTFTIPYHYNL